MYGLPGADPGFVERGGGGGAAATASATGAKVFGGSRLKTLFGISKGGGAPPAPPPESVSAYCGQGINFMFYNRGCITEI